MLPLSNLLNQFQIKTQNITIYETAFTHSSYAHDYKLVANYEKLEFLGDAVLELVVTEHLYKKYTQLNEGELTRQRIMMVQSKTLIKAAQKINLNEYLKIGNSVKSQEKISENLLEDVFEAFIGAVYLDQGINKCRQILKRTVIHLYEIHSLNEMRDYKTMLQEYMQKFPKHDIRYTKMPSNNPNEVYVGVYINNLRKGIGKGSKIKDAQMHAAKNAYLKITKGY